MAAATSTTFFGLILLALVVVAPHAEAAISCGQVARFLAPCRTYVVSGGVVPPACCKGIGDLNNIVIKTIGGRQVVCRCLKSYIASILGIKTSLFFGLFKKCLPFSLVTFDPSTMCIF